MPKVTDAHLEARRRQIVEAAIACFAREGFHRTTMQDICREADLSAGAIYSYFKGKEQIIEAIAAERHSREAAFFEAGRAAATPGEALREVGRAFFRSLDAPGERRRRRVVIQLWAEALRNDTILELVLGGVDPPIAAVAELVRQGQQSGEIPDEVDPEALARATTALFQGFVLQQAWYRELDVEA